LGTSHSRRFLYVTARLHYFNGQLLSFQSLSPAYSIYLNFFNCLWKLKIKSSYGFQNTNQTQFFINAWE
jgi:hypothetical protein